MLEHDYADVTVRIQFFNYVYYQLLYQKKETPTKVFSGKFCETFKTHNFAILSVYKRILYSIL